MIQWLRICAVTAGGMDLTHGQATTIPHAMRRCLKKKKHENCVWNLALVVKNLPANAGDIRDENSIRGSGRSPGEGHSSPLQYSCLENPMNRGAWWATVHRVTQSWTELKWLTTHTYVCMEAGSRVIDKNCSLNYPLLILMLEFLKSGVSNQRSFRSM